MKFVSICSIKDTVSTLPPSIVRQILEAGVVWINQQKNAGTLLEIYGMAGWRRVMIIWEVESAEAIVRVVNENPMGAFLNHEVYALADIDEVMKANIESAKRAEQLFPATK
jgi:hypothetical protein